MNTYSVIILSAILLDYTLGLISDYLNLKKLGTKLPSEFEGVYSPEKYAKSQDYTRTLTKFGFITSTFSLIVLLLFWFTGGFGWLDGIVKNIAEGTIPRGLAYISFLILAQSFISLPFGIYSTFVIEERFGFNKTTPKTYILDILKSLALGIIIGGPVLGAILYILEFTGPGAWLYGWFAVTIFTLLMQYIAPTWIMPLFNKFKPLDDGELKDEIFSYSNKVNYSLKNVFVMDGSRRSSKSNAFFSGFGKNKRIALFDTLIEKLNPKEIVAVLAHEIGHNRKKHVIKGMLISIFHFGVLFYLLSIFLEHEGMYQAFFVNEKSLYTGLIFFGMLYSPIEMLLSVLMNIFSRKHEYEADKFAAETIETPENFISALKKLSEQNLSNLTPHPVNVFLNYSHPPLLKRIEQLREKI